MFSVGKSFKWLLYIGGNVLIVGLVLLFAPGIPPNTSFEYYEVKPVSIFGGKLSVGSNNVLNNAELISDGEVRTPESVSIRGDELFMGDGNGKIVKIKNGKVSTVVAFQFPCRAIDVGSHSHLCTMPLATQFDQKGKLVFTVPAGGVFRVDVDTGVLETLVSRFDKIEGKYPAFSEDISIAKDGTIYWTDGSSQFNIDNIVYEMFGNPSGRLLKYNPVTNTSAVLVDNIHFSNGVQLSENEDFVLVADMMRFRILRHYLKGSKKGQTDVFLDGLPGFVDNIRPNGKGGFYVPIFNLRTEVDIGKYPNVRKLFSRVHSVFDLSISYLYNILPHPLLKKIHQAALSFLVADDFKNAFIADVNNKGEVIGTLQSTNNKFSGISQITLGAKDAYLVSPVQDKIWKIDRKYLKSEQNK